MDLTQEQVAQAYACKTPEELLALATANGIELSEEEARVFFDERAEGELSDEELDNVAGGASGCKRRERDFQVWGRREDVQYIFNIGDVTQAFIGAFIGNETATVRITARGINSREVGTGQTQYNDVYKYDRIGGSPTCLGFGWQNRARFEKPL